MALIYIVEDDDSIRKIEEFTLQTSGHNTCGFTNSDGFFAQVSKVIPDLCILDIMLPGESGNDIVKRLRKKSETANVPVIMVTAKTTDLDLLRGIEDGADDYIKKPFSVIELMSRVKALLRRTYKDEVKKLELDDLVIDDDKHEVTICGKAIDLTYKEYELLSFLVLNKGIVLKRDRIMDQVWGTDYEGESRTIDMHIKTLRQKLGDYGNRIRTVRNVGYVIE